MLCTPNSKAESSRWLGARVEDTDAAQRQKYGGTHTSCSGFEDGRIQIVNLGHLRSSGDRV